MFNYLKNAIAITALLLSFTQVAQADTCNEKDSLYPCGIAFSSVPPTPSLTTANCSSPVPVTYTLHNYGTSDTVIHFSLTENDSLDDPTAVIFGGGSEKDRLVSCTTGQTLVAGQSCTILLKFQPCVAGDLDWDLTVTPNSPQKPLVLELETVVPVAPQAFITNGAGNTVSACPMVSNGKFGQNDSAPCSNVNFTFGAFSRISSPLDAPWNIVLDTLGHYAYISNNGSTGDGTTVVICPVEDPATFGSGLSPCVYATGLDSGSTATFNGPAGLHILDLSSELKRGSIASSVLYVTNSANGTISICPILNDGTLDVCTTVAAGTSPTSISLNESNTLAYVADATTPGNIIIFDVDSAGNLTLNNNHTDGSLSLPVGILMNAIEAIVTNETSSTLSTCAINGSTLDNCVDSGLSSSNFSNPAGLASTSQGLYVANSGDVTVAFCLINLTCSELSDPTFGGPTDVFFHTFSRGFRK